MDDFEKELQAVIDRANADQYCDYYNAEYVGWHIKMLEKYRAFKAKQEALRFEVMSTGLKAAQESNPTEHIHICGDPSSPCDCDCMDRAARVMQDTKPTGVPGLVNNMVYPADLDPKLREVSDQVCMDMMRGEAKPTADKGLVNKVLLLADALKGALEFTLKDGPFKSKEAIGHRQGCIECYSEIEKSLREILSRYQANEGRTEIDLGHCAVTYNDPDGEYNLTPMSGTFELAKAYRKSGRLVLVVDKEEGK